MDDLLSKSIKPFVQHGVIDDNANTRVIAEIERTVIHSMREEGYIPVLDYGPVSFISYNEENQTFDIKIIAYGIYTGRKKAWTLEGVRQHGQIVLPNTPKSKPSASLKNVESP